MSGRTDLAIPAESRETVTRRDRGLCFRCGGKGSEWHHRRSRRVRDEHTHCACNGVWLCSGCHRWAHANPRHAMACGFIVSQWEDEPERRPVETVWGLVRLTCDGKAHFEKLEV